MRRVGRFSKHSMASPIAAINVVPYIDVMLVLLVIFMVVVPKLQQGVEVDLPKVSAREVDVSQSLPIVVTVDKQGLYYLNVGENQNQPIALNVLLPRVLAARDLKNQSPVLIRGDGQANYSYVVELMGFLKKSGLSKVGLLTQSFDSK